MNTDDCRGGAVLHTGGALLVESCLFQSRSASQDGGAIFSSGAGSLEIKNSRFEQCESGTGRGGAICARDIPVCVLKRVNVLGCSAPLEGGAFYVDSTQVTVQDCTVSGCVGKETASSIYLNINQNSQTGSLTFEGNHIESDVDGKSYIVYPNMNCYSTDTVYGAVSLTLTGCTFDNHGRTVTQYVFLEQYFNTLTLSACTFRGIHVQGNGGGFTAVSTPGSEIWQQEVPETLTVQDCVFGFLSSDGNAGAISSGLAYGVTIKNCTFEHCRAGQDGGAIYITNALKGQFKFSDSRIVNSSSVSGAVMSCLGSNTWDLSYAVISAITFTSCVSDGPIIKLEGPSQNQREPARFTSLHFRDIKTKFWGGIMGLPFRRYGVSYDRCVFENVQNSSPNPLAGILPACLYSSSVDVPTSLDGCVFADCACDAGNILLGYSSDTVTAKPRLTLTITDCQLRHCQAQGSIIGLTSQTITIGTIDLTCVELYDCTAKSENLISLSAQTVDFASLWVISENQAQDRLIHVEGAGGSVAFVLVNCSFDANGGRFSNGFLQFNTAALTSLELRDCKFANMVLQGSVCFCMPEFPDLTTLNVIDCVFDNLVFEDSPVIAGDGLALVVNGSTFRRCSSKQGVVNLTNYKGESWPIEGCIFEADTTSGVDGSIIYVQLSEESPITSISLNGCSFSELKCCPLVIECNSKTTSFAMGNSTFSNNNVSVDQGVLCVGGSGSGLSYELCSCVFCNCSTVWVGGLISLSGATTLTSSGSFSGLNLSECVFDGCSSGRYLLEFASASNGPVIFDNCTFTNGVVAVALECASFDVDGSTFISDGSASDSVLSVSVGSGPCSISGSTFIFGGASEDIKNSMIELSCAASAVCTLRDCCFSADRDPASGSDFGAFLSLSGDGEYSFAGDMCFDMTFSASVKNASVISGVESSMFECDRCSRPVYDSDSPGVNPAQNKGMGTAEIAGIAIALLIFVILIVLLALYLIRRRRHRTWATTSEQEDKEFEDETVTFSETSTESQDGSFVSEENPLFRDEALGLGPSFEEHYVM